MAKTMKETKISLFELVVEGTCIPTLHVALSSDLDQVISGTKHSRLMNNPDSGHK